MSLTYKPEHLLKGIIYLDNSNLEEYLISSKTQLKISHKSTLFENESVDNDVFFDLSQVRFAELSAITQLALIIESYLKNNFQVFVAIPTNRLTNREKESLNYDEEKKAAYLKNRRDANSFLKTVGFVDAIKCSHLKNKKEILISEDFDFDKDFDFENFKNAFSVVYESSSTASYNYKYLYPLTWINCQKGFDGFSQIENKIDKILESPERGLDSIDVQGIKNVVLSELIKNVQEHSGSDFALFTIGLVNAKGIYSERISKRINPIEMDYINWAKLENIKSQVEIYFGDSGCGILSKKLEDAFRIKLPNKPFEKLALLQWAFSKWSTSKTDEKIRGTKGLYRILRIVNKYNGIFHIRTEKLNGGYRKGGLKKEEWKSNRSQFEMPGTFIQIKMCPYSESKKFRFTLKENDEKKQWRSIKYHPKIDTDFIERFKKEIICNENLLVILDLNDLSDKDAILLLEDNLSEFSFDAHPNAVVIYLLSKLGNDTLDSIVNSVNEKIVDIIGNSLLQEIANKDAENVYDPVLVIGNNNEIFWYGGNQKLIDLLNESYEDRNNKIRISELNSFKRLDTDTQNRIRLHLENDNYLVIVDNEEKFLFNFTSIDDFFEREIKSLYLSPNDTKICTPKLEIIDQWIEIGQSLENNKYGYALTLYLEVRNYFDSKFNNSYYDKINKKYLFILIDHNQQKGFARAFASLIGIKTRNIINIADDLNTQIPRRTKLFSENDKVIILTTVISSSETIRRLVKYAKRDLAEPLVICCLCNLRNYDITQLETWNDKTDIISIYQKNKKNSERFARNKKYYQNKYKNLLEVQDFRGPNFNVEKKLNSLDISNEINLNLALREHIINTKSLHYNHIGIFRDRHFSFYLNKERILREDSVIWNKIRVSINNWKDKIKTTGSEKVSFTIVYPNSLVFNQDNKNNFYNFLKTLTPFVKLVTNLELINDSNVVYLDFGMITGSSINRIITRTQEVDNLLICVIFNQSKNNDFDVYNRIDTINNQPTAFGQKITKFKIDYLYKLSLSFFTSESCPICEHIAALDKYKINQEYIYDFSKDRQRRLKIIESEDIQKSECPNDFYYTVENSNNEISSEIIMKMYEFKLLFEKSEYSTQFRIVCFRQLFDIYKNIDEEIVNCESKLYALIYFLAHEVNWLQKEPLVFRDMRVMLSEISLRIATINISNLIVHFNSTNRTNTTSDKLVIRYKYAAISLLRSANKLLFCENIARIIYSSHFNNHQSDNLTQNTFYHLISLFKYSYNKSIKYFDAIKLEIKKVNKLDLNFNIKQSIALHKVETLNSLALKNIAHSNMDSDYKIILSLKDEFNEVYEGNHPLPIEYYTKIFLPRYDSIFNDYEIYKEEAENFHIIEIRQAKLVLYWKSTYEFISNTIIFHLQKLSDDFYKSHFFTNSFSNFFVKNNMYKDIDRFTELIYQISYDLNSYNQFKNEFTNLYNKIYSTFIQKKGNNGEQTDSHVLNFLSYFPANILEAINKVFNIKVYPRVKVINDININAFYPKNTFLVNLDLITSNIEGKKNIDINVNDINIIIEIIDNNTETCTLQISYDGTNNYKKVKNNGSLSYWKNELKVFGGDLEYKLEDNGFFKLKIKLLKYDR